MPKTSGLILYTTENCHLCEYAQQLIFETLGETVKEVDIIDDDGLMARYGVRIPVLQHIESQTELNWPFTGQDIANLIDNTAVNP